MKSYATRLSLILFPAVMMSWFSLTYEIGKRYWSHDRGQPAVRCPSMAEVKATPAPAPASTMIVPSPALAPEDVVFTQVESLARNDRPYKDAGIAQTFALASPSNRAVTGPIERFASMVRNPLYRDLIDARSTAYGVLKRDGDRASQRVTIVSATGERISYEFKLRRQQAAPYAGCWMTEAVFRL